MEVESPTLLDNMMDSMKSTNDAKSSANTSSNGSPEIVDTSSSQVVSLETSELKTLVRAYVRTSNTSEKARLYTAVLSMSQYRLPRWKNDGVEEKERKRILKRCKHEWSLNETSWKNETKEQIEYTNCKIRRCSKGFMEYNDAQTGDPVDAEVYEQRVLEYIGLTKKRNNSFIIIATSQETESPTDLLSNSGGSASSNISPDELRKGETKIEPESETLKETECTFTSTMSKDIQPELIST